MHPELSNSLFYFYSTVAQVTAALIALYGIFVIFCQQVIEEKTKLTIEAFKNFHKTHLRTMAIVNQTEELWLEKDVSAHLRLDIACTNERYPNLVLALTDYYLQLNAFLCFKEALFRRLIINTFFLMAILMASLCALFQFPNNLIILDSSRFVIILSLTVALIYLFYSIIMALKGPSLLTINNPEITFPLEMKDAFSREGIQKIIETKLAEHNITLTFKAKF